MKRLLFLLAVVPSAALAQPIGGRNVPTVAVNPIDWLNEVQRLDITIEANIACPQQAQACRQVVRQDTFLVAKSLAGELTFIQAFMTNLDTTGQPVRGGRYLVWITRGQVVLKLRRDDWPSPFLDPQEEAMSSPWFTFGVVWSFFYP